MARQGNHDESIVFLLQNFSPPQVSHRLTHQLIERMYDVFQNEKSGELIDAGNFVEKQNNFVISDLLITTLVRYLVSTYNKDYRIQESFTHLIEVYQSDSTKSRGREHHIAQALCGRSTA